MDTGPSVLAIRRYPDYAPRLLDPRQYPEDVPVCESFRPVTGGFLDRLRPDSLSTFESCFSVVGGRPYYRDPIDVWWGFYLPGGLLPLLETVVPLRSIAESAGSGVTIHARGVALVADAIDEAGGLPNGFIMGRQRQQVEAFLRLSREHGLALSVG